jgi:hypothetical protein
MSCALPPVVQKSVGTLRLWHGCNKVWVPPAVFVQQIGAVTGTTTFFLGLFPGL